VLLLLLLLLLLINDGVSMSMIIALVGSRKAL